MSSKYKHTCKKLSQAFLYEVRKVHFTKVQRDVGILNMKSNYILTSFLNLTCHDLIVSDLSDKLA